MFDYSSQAYYQHIKARQPEAPQEDLFIQEVLRIRHGQKRIGAHKLLVMMAPFMAAHNIHIGRDTFLKLLSERCLLIRKRRRSKPQTTVSSHWLRKYPNLAVGFVPRAAGQLWISDITYIPM
ncbi:hypothetical protein [Pontibacter pudoricolor]|uniref:hypothetical protein n=1 Tax=Pontibacter pudoricolor TaxID=2694930 RepID=UPI0013920330|nr:hypothetical protein [Pontibacter pudoricolor]